MYSRIFVSLPFQTVMSKTQSSLNVLVVALIFPVAAPTTKTRPPCATNSGGFGYVISISSTALRTRVPTMRSSQRPVLAGDDPLNAFVNQRQQCLLVAASYRCKEILHNLHIL